MTKLAWLASIAPMLLGVGCQKEVVGAPPPAQAFYFPIGVAATPLDPAAPEPPRYLYVANSDFDLRFNAGWVSVVDIDSAAAGLSREQAIVQQVKVPALCGELAVHRFATPQGDILGVAVLAHRGSRLLTLLEIRDDGATLSCGDANATAKLSSEEERTDCDRQHLVKIDPTDPGWQAELTDAQVEDPYAVALFDRVVGAERHTYLAVGFISSGRLLLYELHAERLGTESKEPVLEPVRAVALGTSGVGHLAVRPGADGPFLAATSRLFGSNSERSTLYVVDVGRSLDEQKDIVSTVRFAGSVGGSELVDLAFSPDGQRAFVSNNAPDSLLLLDTSLAQVQQADESLSLFPKDLLLTALPLEGRPAGVDYLQRAAGDLVAAASFADDKVFFVSALGSQLTPVALVEDVGSGPFEMTTVDSGGRQLLFVTTFFDHGLAVIEVPPTDVQQTRRIAHLRDADLGVSNAGR